MRAWRVFTLALCLLVPIETRLAFAQEGASPRVALVIGNAKYRDAEADMPSAASDASAIAAELQRQGYAVSSAEDATRAELAGRSERLLRDIRSGATVVVYFNGYAIQSGRQNYLMPVDGSIWSETDVQRDGLSLTQLIGEISGRGAADTYVVVEGANRNPYERRFRNFSIGLAPVAVLPPSTSLMLSAPPGTVLRPPTGPRGVLATELVKQVSAERGISPAVLEKTRTAVLSASKDAQAPWIFSTRTEPAKPSGSGTAPSATGPSPPPRERTETASRDDRPVQGAQGDGKPPSKPETGPVASKPETGAAPSKPETGPAPSKPEVEAGPSKPETGATPEGEKPGAAPSVKKVEIAQLPYGASDQKLLKDLSDAIARNPNDSVSLYTRGQIYALHYDFKLALADFDRVLTINATDVEALNNRCWIRAIIDELDGAIADCNAALKLRPNFLDALDSRGFVMLKIGLPRRAISDYDAALKLNDRHASALYGRGVAHRRLGQAGPSDRDIKLALAIDPKIGEQFSLFGLK